MFCIKRSDFRYKAMNLFESCVKITTIEAIEGLPKGNDAKAGPTLARVVLSSLSNNSYHSMIVMIVMITLLR